MQTHISLKPGLQFNSLAARLAQRSKFWDFILVNDERFLSSQRITEGSMILL